MSNSVKFSIDGTTNAEQVAGRAKAAVGGLEKQLQDIGKKFGTSFKDIFLSFLGPMALLGAAIAYIGKIIEDIAKKREEANQAAIAGTNALMSAEDKYWANKRNNEKQTKKEIEEAKTQRITTTREFLQDDPRRNQVVDEVTFNYQGAERLARRKDVQDKVQSILSPETAAAGVGSGLSGKPFKSPEGFGNVIGVGSNPVLEAMTSQLEEAKRTNDILTQLALGGGGRTTTWLSAADSPAPSRAAMLQGK